MTEIDLVARAEVGTQRLSVYYDEGCESPREGSNLGTMVCWHRRYDLGDTHGHDTPYDFWFELLVKVIGDPDDAEEWVAKAEDDWGEENWEDWEFVKAAFQEVGGYDEYVILPLYLYDHSGITINTVGFHCPWDSGQIGWIYASKKRFLKETMYTEKELFSKDVNRVPEIGEHVKVKGIEERGYGQVMSFCGGDKKFLVVDFDFNKALDFRKPENAILVSLDSVKVMSNRAEEMLIDEVKVYDQYLTCDIYYYLVEERTVCCKCGHETWNVLDSCGGFYGRDWNENGLLDAVGDQELADALETV